MLFCFRCSLKYRQVLFSIQKRYRYKKKWATYKKQKCPTDQALSYFDSFYKPVYGTQWPSIRQALLSQQKYCALVNNFYEDVDDVCVNLITEGADDFIKNAAEAELKDEENSMESGQVHSSVIDSANLDQQWMPTDYSPQDEAKGMMLGDLAQLPGQTVAGSPNMTDFMPVKRIMSQGDELSLQEVSQGFYVPDELEVQILQEKLVFPPYLKAYTQERGEISLFPAPDKDSSGKLGYYLFDGASVLPVLALGLRPGDVVLDLCAAPGGKSLTILQTMLAEKLTCVDSSYGRLKRLKDILHWYVPRSRATDDKVQVLKMNGIHFCEENKQRGGFDKILVDVPCYTDRHVLTEEDNNIFQKSRQKERLYIQEVQRELLIGAIHCCRPGGSIVYSTCTLSMPQNDGTVQAALEHIWENTNIELAVVDTKEIAQRFAGTFNFYNRCRYGQLVLPNVTANFGPMYFCKLRRIK